MPNAHSFRKLYSDGKPENLFWGAYILILFLLRWSELSRLTTIFNEEVRSHRFTSTDFPRKAKTERTELLFVPQSRRFFFHILFYVRDNLFHKPRELATTWMKQVCSVSVEVNCFVLESSGWNWNPGAQPRNSIFSLSRSVRTGHNGWSVHFGRQCPTNRLNFSLCTCSQNDSE